MTNYNNITSNTYLHRLLKRYNPNNWSQHPDDGSYLIPAGIGTDGIVITQGASYFYEALFQELQDPDTRRWIFDSDQAVEFSQLGMNPAQDDGSEAISPFPRFYMEFTTPLTGVVAEEPGYQDATVALVFRENAVVVPDTQLLVDIQNSDITFSSATFFLQSFFEGTSSLEEHDIQGDGIYKPFVRIGSSDTSHEGHIEVDDSKDATYYTDRSFKIHLPTGQAWVTPMLTTDGVHDSEGNEDEWAIDSNSKNEELVKKWIQEGIDNNFDTDYWANRDAIGRFNAASTADPTTGTNSEIPKEWLEKDNLTKFYPAGAIIKGMEDRRIGYWETITQQYCDMFIWILMYIQSKQIVITELMPQRSERRRLQRKGEVPQPWHILKVDPKLMVNLNQIEGSKTGATHGHRYDVRAHWRRQTIRYGPKRQLTKRVTQYIPSHMRGLQNEIYVPKTRKMENQHENA